MKPETKIRLGLGTVIFLLVGLIVVFISVLCKGSILSASIGLLEICVFLVYLQGIIKKDVQLARRAFRTSFIISMVAYAIILLSLSSAYSDHVIGISGVIYWLLCFGLTLLTFYFLIIGIDGLLQHPNGTNKSAKVKVLWWAFLPFMIAAFLGLLWIFAPLLNVVKNVLRNIFG
jgi:hypothetical protein